MSEPATKDGTGLHFVLLIVLMLILFILTVVAIDETRKDIKSMQPCSTVERTDKR